MTHDEMIAVIAAHRDGKAVEARCRPTGGWISASVPCWDFYRSDYRIKPEPMVIWANVYPHGLGHAYETEIDALARVGSQGIPREFMEVLP